jgi:hypothetical protein
MRPTGTKVTQPRGEAFSRSWVKSGTLARLISTGRSWRKPAVRQYVSMRKHPLMRSNLAILREPQPMHVISAGRSRV